MNKMLNFINDLMLEAAFISRRAMVHVSIVLCVMTLIPFWQVSAASSASATTVRLAKTDGNVSVLGDGGMETATKANMRLFSGNHVKTEQNSYAWVNLDDSKAAKLDALSEMEVRKDGNNLEVLATTGNLFFNVSQPLKSDENLNIRTSTMVTGIRGTCGILKAINAAHTQVDLFSGHLDCTVINPVTGESQSLSMNPGDSAHFYTYDPTGAGAGTFIETGKVSAESIDGFALTEIVENRELVSQIAEASSIDLSNVSAQEAEQRLAEDQASVKEASDEVQRQVAQQASQQSNQPNTPSVDPVWSSSSSSSSSGSSSSSSSGSSQTNTSPMASSTDLGSVNNTGTSASTTSSDSSLGNQHSLSEEDVNSSDNDNSESENNFYNVYVDVSGDAKVTLTNYTKALRNTELKIQGEKDDRMDVGIEGTSDNVLDCVVLSFMAVDGSGNVMKEWETDGNSSLYSYAFEMPASDVSITIVCAEKHKITYKGDVESKNIRTDTTELNGKAIFSSFMGESILHDGDYYTLHEGGKTTLEIGWKDKAGLFQVEVTDSSGNPIDIEGEQMGTSVSLNFTVPDSDIIVNVSDMDSTNRIVVNGPSGSSLTYGVYANEPSNSDSFDKMEKITEAKEGDEIYFVLIGREVTFTIKNDLSGSEIERKQQNYEWTMNADTDQKWFTFTMPASDVTITIE